MVCVIYFKWMCNQYASFYIADLESHSKLWIPDLCPAAKLAESTFKEKKKKILHATISAPSKYNILLCFWYGQITSCLWGPCQNTPRVRQQKRDRTKIWDLLNRMIQMHGSCLHMILSIVLTPQATRVNDIKDGLQQCKMTRTRKFLLKSTRASLS